MAGDLFDPDRLRKKWQAPSREETAAVGHPRLDDVPRPIDPFDQATLQLEDVKRRVRLELPHFRDAVAPFFDEAEELLLKVFRPGLAQEEEEATEPESEQPPSGEEPADEPSAAPPPQPGAPAAVADPATEADAAASDAQPAEEPDEAEEPPGEEADDVIEDESPPEGQRLAEVLEQIEDLLEVALMVR